MEDPKRNKSWVSPGEASTSTARPNRYGRKVTLCVWWDQTGVIYFELLKPSETVNAVRYKQQMKDLSRAIAENRPEYHGKQKKVLLLDTMHHRISRKSFATRWEIQVGGD